MDISNYDSDYLKFYEKRKSNSPHFELPSCELGFNSRSTVVTAFTNPYRVYLHKYGEDIHVSESILAGSANGNMFEAYTRIIMTQMLNALNIKNPVIVDIGANIGLHALYFGSLGFEVHAFEPFKKNSELLSCSISANRFYNIKLNKFGLSELENEMCMDVPQKNNHGHAVVSKSSKCENPLKFKRLDDYINSDMKGIIPDVIKIDIEGHEFKALITAKEIFKLKKPKLIFSEFYPVFMREQNVITAEYWQYLKDLGYEVFDLRGKKVTLENIDRNMDIVAIDKNYVDVVYKSSF
ncbi:hypothetical protein HK099_007515 [Clydaea vesicula]|uniref:Methyltransferase FkbM domain-containing protein n=1 Tax=Clydaea vesicula TaxID=447962 RepID=A0AAD5TX58_9FUNG|nr:hypothetical protein HK099_007515 [Clydaea vesicula]KAJ3390068.1 hypothetical protein HDU92_000659 [Lobulomyces angularis]